MKKERKTLEMTKTFREGFCYYIILYVGSNANIRIYYEIPQIGWVSSKPFGIHFCLPIHHLQMTSSEEFQQHFSIISKFVCCYFYMKTYVAFTLISFTVLKSDDCLSVQLPFNLPFQIPVEMFLELEPN